MTYCIYHIPGKKIGVTKNLDDRVTRQQGYAPGEYEVLEMSDDISYISNREVELQRLFGYKVDSRLYSDLKPNKTKLKSMKLNVTEQTTTFPCPVSKLKGQLMDELGSRWETEHGTFELTAASVAWIMSNVKTSYYNKERSFVYNKAMSKGCDLMEATKVSEYKFMEALNELCAEAECEEELVQSEDYIFEDIRDWARERGIFEKGDIKTQYLKLIEEAGELGRAILKSDEPEIVDAIGDMVVVLTNLSHLAGYRIENCIQSAYDTIAARTGKMVNGTFVKD
jgi:NTP pyrophosphatase (non-canonical NTP hydrolase)